MPSPPPAPERSRTGLPYRPDGAAAGPPEVVEAIRARRPGGRLLRLDRMLLHSPALAQGWNDLLGAIRGKLSLLQARPALPGRPRRWQHAAP